jgi:glutaredoxin
MSRRGAGAVSASAPPAATDASAPIVVFTTPGCPYCKRAKDALRGGDFKFAEVDVSVDKQLRALLADTTGQRTVPQVRGRTCAACACSCCGCKRPAHRKLVRMHP